MSHFLVTPAPRLGFMTTIGDTNYQTEDGINLVTSGAVTITAVLCICGGETCFLCSNPNQPPSPDLHQS